jgi:hypothetical protein
MRSSDMKSMPIQKIKLVASRWSGIVAKRCQIISDLQWRQIIDVYFCDSTSPWQRGSNEDTNRLLRQYYRKRDEFVGALTGRVGQSRKTSK